ncbi:hypothetical protein GWK47_020229 [Chionoecetes opilio]|uniref:Uncharacterized protein n=1 Tax=Chionoecetes opilio TaxID=41210 RepID=A0A8J4XPC9_CHIOP|nr:hypothetical protein GWK47_020229 [Chionoecetes opilio]
MWFKHIRNVVLEQHELRTLQSLLQDYIQMLRTFGMNVGVVKSCTIKTMIQEEFHDRIGFHERYQKNHSALVYDTYSGGSYAEAAINCWGVTDDQLISTVAQRINAHASQAQVMSWPPHVDELVDEEDSEELLYKFVTLLKKPKVGEDQKDPAVLALTSLLTSYITGKRTSFKVRLAVMLYGLTQSREIIDLMHKFSFGISYKDVLNLYDAWAKFDIETNRACPDELAMGQPGTTVMGNDEFKDDTLTGANTSHRTNVMFVQPQDLVETSAVSRQSLSIPTADDMKALCASQTSCTAIQNCST